MADNQEGLSGRLEGLYQRMKESQVDAYLVLSSDNHLNEYTPE